MAELHNWTMTEIIDYYADYVRDECGMEVSKQLAKKLFLNALTYNVVREEVINQMFFLLEEE